MAEERPVLRRRHSAQLKTLVLEQCAEPGASVAKVAMSHGLNANMVHGWLKLAPGRDSAALALPSSAALPLDAATSALQFVPLSMPLPPSPPAPADIQIELRRGATAMKITWPITAAAECAAWMRELLR